MGVRRTRLDLRQYDQQVSRRVNGLLKRKERARRDTRLRALLVKGSLPYTPTIMAWLSHAIEVPSNQITPEDVQKFLASPKVVD